MPPTGSGISVRHERVGTVDWSDGGYSDQQLIQRVEKCLPELFERLHVEDGSAECSVNLSGNKLRGAAPIASILRSLRENQVQVTTIRLHKNQFTDDAMSALVEHIDRAASDNRPLTELHLSDNRLTEDGIRSLVKAAHRCKAYSKGDAPPPRNGGRVRSFWLRTENQQPPVPDPHGVLERLAADGYSVCLLPSKEYQPQGASARKSLEAPVHMHHAFAPRSELRASPEPAWGKGEAGWRKGEATSSRDWWAEGGKGKDGKDGKGKGYAPAKGKGYEKGSSYEKGGKGKDWDWDGQGQGQGQDWDRWGYDWDDDGDDDYGGRSRRRGEDSPTGRGGGKGGPADHASRAAMIARERERLGGRPIPRDPASAGSPPRRYGQGDPQAVQNPFQLSPYSSGSVWLLQACDSVRLKVKACKQMGVLRTSLNPTTAPEEDWRRLSRIGLQCITRTCAQRASVFVGSFLEEGGLHELSYACSCEASLAFAFRQLRLVAFFPIEVIQDEWNDSQCASLFAAVFGEIVDLPGGESNAIVNARTVAEWALLDFLFFLASSQVVVANLKVQQQPQQANGQGQQLGYDG